MIQFPRVHLNPNHETIPLEKPVTARLSLDMQQDPHHDTIRQGNCVMAGVCLNPNHDTIPVDSYSTAKVGLDMHARPNHDTIPQGNCIKAVGDLV